MEGLSICRIIQIAINGKGSPLLLHMSELLTGSVNHRKNATTNSVMCTAGETLETVSSPWLVSKLTDTEEK